MEDKRFRDIIPLFIMSNIIARALNFADTRFITLHFSHAPIHLLFPRLDTPPATTYI